MSHPKWLLSGLLPYVVAIPALSATSKCNAFWWFLVFGFSLSVLDLAIVLLCFGVRWSGQPRVVFSFSPLRPALLSGKSINCASEARVATDVGVDMEVDVGTWTWTWPNIYQMTSGRGSTYGPTEQTLSEPAYGRKMLGFGPCKWGWRWWEKGWCD